MVKIYQIQRIFKQIIAKRQRHYWKSMELLEPPNTVRGMLILERDAFQKNVLIPRLRVQNKQAHKVLPILKKLLLKVEQLKPVRVVQLPDGTSFREILLHPTPVKSWESLPVEALKAHDINQENFYFDELQLSYENWRADEILKSVLPPNEEGVASFSHVGHIVHVNLRDHLLLYKNIIGQVFLDKVPKCRCVVNKAAIIDNTYRNFAFELLAGLPEYQVETKENGVVYELDFSRVYWNPRLCTEHARIVELLGPGDVLYDIFAGVGPFSVPAARKGCIVFANDLNPESYRWLVQNMKRNKCVNNVQLFNKDGREFIMQNIRADLMERVNAATSKANYNIHITMNLPGMAAEFLDAFRGLLKDAIENPQLENINLPTVHVYCFARETSSAETKDIALELVEENLGLKLRDSLQCVHFVRNVASNKDMFRVSFHLNKEMLTTDKTESGSSSQLKAQKRVAADEKSGKIDKSDDGDDEDDDDDDDNKEFLLSKIPKTN